MDNPFTIRLYDKHLSRTGWVNNPLELSITPAHNQVGSATISVASNHKYLDALRTHGARAVIHYYDEHLMSGYITRRAGAGPSRTGRFDFTLQDDLWLIWRMLGWPAPGSSITAQGTKSDVRTGAAETVAKAFVSANLAHNTVDPIVVAPDLGRGSSISPPGIRMTNLADALMTLVDTAGIGLSARQVGTEKQGTGILLDAYVPRVYPHILSEAAGTIASYSWSDDDPTMTRNIIGGPNEGTNRQFRQSIDGALETDYGYTNEGFVDASSADTVAAILKAGTDALTENGPKAGFSVELAETKNFRYGGSGVHVGDQVPVDIGGNTLTDVLRKATLTFNPDDGLVIEPNIGDHTDDPTEKVLDYVDKLSRGVDNLRTQR